jgi:hypothetical protein
LHPIQLTQPIARESAACLVWLTCDSTLDPAQSNVWFRSSGWFQAFAFKWVNAWRRYVAGKEMLVPLTSSLYVPGKLGDPTKAGFDP